jgi:hypothetical protein
MSTRIAANNPNFTLSITPTVCVVDVVHDGNNQLLQTQSEDCSSQLPLLVPTQETPASAPLFSLPFVGAGDGGQPVVLQNRTATPWSSVTSARNGQTTVSTPPHVSIATGGVIVAVLVIAVSVDLAIFELRFSRKALTWLRGLLSRKG